MTDAAERAALWEAWQDGRYPSLEILVPDTLPLAPHGLGLLCATRDEEIWLRLIADFAAPTARLPLSTQPDCFPLGPPPILDALYAYAAECLTAGRVLPPPDLPFD